MTKWLYVLFSFHGRIGRRDWWIGSILTMVLSAVSLYIYHKVFSYHPVILGSLITVFLIWIRLALNVKRLHDRNLSGLFALLEIIPFLGGLILFIYCGFVRGVDDENRFHIHS